MTTICSKCGSTLAANADILFCPQCGTPTPAYYSSTAASSYEPTASAAPYQSNIPATSSINAEKNPYAPFTGTMVLNDPLTDNSKGYGWDEGTVSDGSYCKFTGATYHDNRADPHYIHPCFALNTNYSTFTYELKMTILTGGCGGLIFMADGANSKYFVFDVCQDGSFSLFYFSGFGQSGTWVRTPQSTSIINSGLNQSNLVAVTANRNNVDLYVNSQKIDSVVDDA